MSNPAFVETKGVLADVYSPAKFSAAKKKALQGLMFKSFSGVLELNKRSLESFVEWPDRSAAVCRCLTEPVAILQTRYSIDGDS
jgi:hypothetical protein